jgi:hypothetical protein
VKLKRLFFNLNQISFSPVKQLKNVQEIFDSDSVLPSPFSLIGRFRGVPSKGMIALEM